MMSRNAIKLLEARYLMRDREGNLVESADGLLRRVAKAIAAPEGQQRRFWERQFYLQMKDALFLPNSPTLMNAGLSGGQLSACFVLPVEDSMEAIFETLKKTARIHQSGGGTGFNFSHLRPEGALVSGTMGRASGPVSFIKVYDAATAYIKQGGKRRGANMAILNVNHPDILSFITAKEKDRTLENFNLSVGITDAFMKRVEGDGIWELKHPGTNRAAISVSARLLWKKICDSAWRQAEPGLIFLDTINRNRTLPELPEIEATNPCGEVPLLPYESCNLGSINLSRFYIKNSLGESEIDWKKLQYTVEAGIRFLDNVITSNTFLYPEIEKNTLANRKVGLGVMGWAELLFKLKIPYASEQAVQLAHSVMEFIQAKSYSASAQLAEDRGVFPNWEKSIFYPDKRMRNTCCNSIAPTGSISVLAGTSYSIEPLYALSFERHNLLETTEPEPINPELENTLRKLGIWSEEVKVQIRSTGSAKHIGGLSRKLKRVFRTAHEIHWKYHLLHQQAFQRYTDNAVSKTINLKSSTSPATVQKIYYSAWKMGLKGVTIYRDGSRTGQVLQHCSSTATCEL